MLTPKQAYWTAALFNLEDERDTVMQVIATQQAKVAEYKKRSEEWNKEVYEPRYKRALQDLNLMADRPELLNQAIAFAQSQLQEATNEVEDQSGSESLG